MTTPSHDDSADSAQPPSPSSHESETDVSTPGSGADQSPGTTERSPPAAAPAGEDGLPDWEPLTPELVEEEAIRGDFMLRWAVVLLAVLLGCTEIDDPSTLVHIRTGQYIAAHGWLPPRQDVFSYTAGDRLWINLAWLFDLVLAGVYGAGGAAGLVALKALLGGVAFFLLGRVSHREVPTWWGSVCGALALLACYQHFVALPAAVTLLGLAAVWTCLHRLVEEKSLRSLWALPAVFCIWANLDERMFVGLALLALFVVGESLGAAIGRGELADGPGRKHLWAVLGASIAAALVHPFGWHTLASPAVLYGAADPALRMHLGTVPDVDAVQFYPLWQASFWQALTHHALAALLLAVITAVVLVLNRKRVSAAHVLVFVGFLGLAVLAGRELPALAVVCAVLATLDAQVWYRANFRQDYSVETSELLFSRGGRAATVLALFAVAFLAVGGRLSGPNRNRIGIGFSPALKASIDGMREDLTGTYDDRPFHFRMEQGDLLIWTGKQTFVDSRAALFAGSGREDLWALHDATRRALRRQRPSQPGSGRPDVWKRTFETYRLTHVIPRLDEINCITYVDLRHSPQEWELTRLGGVVAVFHRSDLEGSYLQDLPGYREFLETRHVDPVAWAFREAVPPPRPRAAWGRKRTFYQKYLTLPRSARPLELQRAVHYHQHLEFAAEGRLPLPPEIQAAFAILAIRSSNAALAQDPQNAEAYRLLGSVYAQLGNLEAAVMRSAGRAYVNPMRYFQSLHGYGQSLTIDPASAETHLRLYRTYVSSNKLDLALKSLNAYDELAGEPEQLSPEELSARRNMVIARRQLSEQVEAVSVQVEKELEQQPDLLQVAAFAYGQGCPLVALTALERDTAYLHAQPMAMLLRGRLLMEAGRSEDAQEQFVRLEGIAEQTPLANWHSPAAMAHLGIADYAKALQLWNDRARLIEERANLLLTTSLPLTDAPHRWPLAQTTGAVEALYLVPDELAELWFYAALAHIENGELQPATRLLQRVLERHPETALRPLVRFYLYLLSDELVDAYSPAERIPVTPDMFAPEPP